MTTATQLKCACEPCKCVVSTDLAVMKDGKYYCGEACANGHSSGESCCEPNCSCC
ncbi:MAG: metallothionein [Cyanobacteriota bacterium]|nr:metallothionein [Cyanobacteriota bacterium]